MSLSQNFMIAYNGKFNFITERIEAEKPAPKSAKPKGTFYSRDFDGNFQFIADEDETGIDQAIISG